MALDEATTKRFWDKVDQRGPDECWPWLGAIHNKLGHGSFRFDGRARVASRYALMVKLDRPLRAGEKALHDCDNPPCCNPRHVYAGSTLDNYEDATARGRQAWQKMTACKNGHPRTEGSTYSYGNRSPCKECQSARTAKYKARLAAKGTNE